MDIVPKIGKNELFNDPTYINVATECKTLKLNQFLPKIMEKYEQEKKEEGLKSHEMLSRRSGMEEDSSILQHSAGNSNE
jgi:hypothetical protein